MMDALENISDVVSPESFTSSTAAGCSSRSALNGPLLAWHPMSPREPVPKSHPPRHPNG